MGGAMPAAYTQRLTATDIALLNEQNQALRNDILGRYLKCPVCNEDFLGYENDKKEKHFTDHQGIYLEEGRCVWCSSTHWRFMTVSQRRAHMNTHFLEGVKKATVTTIDARCPACNLDFRGMSPNEIALHGINNHQPGTAAFCTKCGIQETRLSPAETAHHQRTCLNMPDKPEGDTSIPGYCERCGKDTSQQNARAAILHARDCTNATTHGNDYCRKCGINKKGWDQPAKENHKWVCKPPNGWKGHYCQKCGQRLSNRDKSWLANHTQSCWNNLEPQPAPLHEKIQGMLIKLAHNYLDS